MGEPLLIVEGLRVDYEDVTAVKDVSFAIEAGMVYGLVGPNGAGKTSIIRVLATLLNPTYGRVRVKGVDLLDDPWKALRWVGFMPDFPPLYEDLTVREFLELFASAYGVPASERRPRIEALVQQVDLTLKLDMACGGLSRGMKQRLFLAKTLLHDPELLLLDEPASGLDPQARLDLAETLRALGRAGKAVLISSHILAEMADFCNSVGIMEQGRMVVSGRISDILKDLQPGRELRIRLVAPDDRLGGWLGGRDGIGEVSIDGRDARCVLRGDDEAAAALLRDLIQSGASVVSFYEREGDLQDIFMKVSQGRVA